MVSSLEIGVLMDGLEWIGYKFEGADVFVSYVSVWKLTHL